MTASPSTHPRGTVMKLISTMLVLAAAALGVCGANAAPIPVATWGFNDTFAADEFGAPALTPIDPLGLNSFMTDTVFGVSQRVYRYDGNPAPASPTQQAGLSVNTTGLLDGDNSYSVEMVFQIEASQSSWKEIFGVSNRTSDNSFYVEPGNKLQIYPIGDGPTTWTFGEYHRVTLTNDGAGHVTSYLDGIFQFDLITSVMDFSTYAVANPDRLIHFFADNLISGGQGEFSDGRVAMIRLYDFELSGDQVGQLESPVPEPGSLLLVGLALMGLTWMRRRQPAPIPAYLPKARQGSGRAARGVNQITS